MSYLPRLPRAVRHTLSPDPKISMSSLPFPHPSPRGRFFVESGCKDTTIFQSGKLFFRFSSKFFPSALCTSVLHTKIFSLCGGNGGAKRGFRGCLPPFFGDWKAGFFGVFAHDAVNQQFRIFPDSGGASGRHARPHRPPAGGGCGRDTSARPSGATAPPAASPCGPRGCAPRRGRCPWGSPQGRGATCGRPHAAAARTDPQGRTPPPASSGRSSTA